MGEIRLNGIFTQEKSSAQKWFSAHIYSLLPSGPVPMDSRPYAHPVRPKEPAERNPRLSVMGARVESFSNREYLVRVGCFEDEWGY